MGLIKRAWRGEVRLWKIFWGGMLGGIALGFLLAALQMALHLPSVATLIIRIIYGIWWLVSVWRCAFNLEWTFWGYVARIYVALVPAMLILVFLVFGAQVGEDLGKMAECRKQMSDYAISNGIDPHQYMHDHADELKKCSHAPATKESPAS